MLHHKGHAESQKPPEAKIPHNKPDEFVIGRKNVRNWNKNPKKHKKTTKTGRVCHRSQMLSPYAIVGSQNWWQPTRTGYRLPMIIISSSLIKFPLKPKEPDQKQKPNTSVAIHSLLYCPIRNNQGPDLYAFIRFIGFIGPDDDDLNWLLILIFDY